MPEYSYRAVDAGGAGFAGSINAANELELERHLESLGYCLIEAKQALQHKHKSNDVVVSRRELIDFFSALESLLSAGIAVTQALEAIIEENQNEKFNAILLDLKINLEAGNTLDSSMRLYPKAFSEQVVNLVKAGEYSGNLAQSCADISDHLEWLDNIVSDVKQASVYPTIILVAVFTLLLIMFTVVVPKFNVLFVSLNIELPALTQAVVNLGEFCQRYWGAILLLFFILLAAITLLPQRVPQLALLLDRIKLGLPLLGELNAMIMQSKFCHNLSLLLHAGVPILEALKLCRNLVGNRAMALAVEDAQQAVNEGRRMTEALREADILSPIVMRMIVIGEETGRLDEALEHASKRFDKELPRKIKKLFAVLEPLIMLVLIVVVGFVAAAIFLPMLSIMSGLG